MIRLVPYAEARKEIRDGDLLLFRGRGFFRRLVRVFGRSHYSHAAMAAWWGDVLMLLEVLQWHGGRAVTLSSQAEDWPGCWDVFEVNPDDRWPEYNRSGAVNHMRRLCRGQRYGWRTLGLIGLSHAPLVRLFLPPETDDGLNGSPPICSHAVTAANRLGGGVDPVPHLADRRTEPGDLARSPFYRYRFTLTV